jgi:antitoxin component YwqK of YwqJK toxin-antitoxin module
MRNKLFMMLMVISPFINAQINKVDEKGKKQGVWEKTYPRSKVLHYKGQFKDDKPVGTFQYYYPSNKIQAIIVHDSKSNRSKAEFYHESGMIMSKGIYRDMKKDSIWLSFGPSGRKTFSETYKADLLNGERIIYYISEDPSDRSERICSRSNYLNGKLDGEQIEYFDGGTVKNKGSYKNNKKEGVWISYYPNGKKMLEQRFKLGEYHGWFFSYNEDGNETAKKYYYHGEPLEGKALEAKMKMMKAKGINPND